jgi:hypothetical protein
MKKFPTAGLCALLLSAALAIPAGASTFLMMDDLDLVAASDAIVVGEVVEQQSFWNAAGTEIVTETTFWVRDVVVGDAPAQVTIRTFGGEVPGLISEAFGEPIFEPGQTQLVMLQKGPAGELRVAGYRQGQYRVVERGDGVAVALPMIGDAHFVTKTGELAPALSAMPLEALTNHLQTVRAELDALTQAPRTDRPAIR